MTWEIRKVWIVRVGMSVAYCGENEERAESVARMAEGRGQILQAMVAVRFGAVGAFIERQMAERAEVRAARAATEWQASG